MTRAAGILLLVVLTACSSGHADVSEQLRRIQEQEAESKKLRESGEAEPLRESTQARLETEVRILEGRLADAERDSSVSSVAATSAALDEARRRLAAELTRQKQLEDLRARTPRKLIKIDSPEAASRLAASGRTASSPSESMPPESRPGSWFGSSAGTASRTASRPGSRPASRPDTRPAASAEELAEFDRLDKRIRWLAELRLSGGDRAGQSRVKRDLIRLTEDFRTKDRTKALEELRKLEREADR